MPHKVLSKRAIMKIAYDSLCKLRNKVIHQGVWQLHLDKLRGNSLSVVGGSLIAAKDILVGTQRPAAQAAATYVRDSSRHCAL